MRKPNFVEPIFAAAGRPYSGSLRKRWDRVLNNLLTSGLFKVELCEPGKIWRRPNGKYNIRVTMPAAGRVWFYYSSSIRPFDVVKTMGKALQSDEGKTVVKSIVDLDNTCKKCQGQGYIPMFSYYCDGVCFDCYGSGYNHKFTPVVELLETKPVTI